MGDLALVLRGMWHRRALLAAVLVVMVLVVGAAAIGPLYLRAAGESVLRDTLTEGLSSARIVSDHLSAPNSSDPLARLQRASADKLSKAPTLAHLVQPPISSMQRNVTINGYADILVYRQDLCDHVRMVRGSCARQPGTAIVSEDTAQAVGWRLGSTLVFGSGAHERVTVSGIYVPLDPTGDYWAAQPYFAAYSGSGMAGSSGSLDAIFAPFSVLRDQPPSLFMTVEVDRHLDLARIRTTDIGPLKHELAAYAVTIFGGPNANFVTSSGTAAVVATLQQAQGIIDSLEMPVIVVEAQLLVLCWLILFFTVANSAEARGQEVALAKLRGAPARTTVAYGLLDTLLVVAAAVPIGLAAAWGGVYAAARLFLAPGTPAILTASAVYAALAGGAGAAVAAGLASMRMLRRPVVEQWRHAARRTRPRHWLVDVVVVAAAVIALVILVRVGAVASGTGHSIALLAPGLLVLAVALLGSRVLPGLCRSAFAATRRSRRLGWFLAVRQLARRPSTLRLTLVLVVAFGLVTFAIDAWAVASGNAHDRGWMETGAAEVLTVTPPQGKDVGTIVDDLDPSGREAAAVDVVADYNGPAPSYLLAVQPARFARVAFWRSDFAAVPLTSLTQQLTVPGAAPVTVTGDRMELDVRATGLPSHPAVLVADVVGQGTGHTTTTLGVVHPGAQTLRGTVDCVGRPCRLAGLHLQRPSGRFYPLTGRLSITALRVHDHAGWHRIGTDLGTPSAWRASDGAGVAGAGSGAVTLTARSTPYDEPTWQVNDHPASLPAVVTPPVQAAGRHTIDGLAPGSSLSFTPSAVATTLPFGGTRSVLVNRAYALRAGGGVTTNATRTIWLAPDAVDTFPRQLEQAGVTVITVASAAQQTDRYEREGPNLAIVLFLVVSVLGAVLAAGGVVLNVHLAGRRRTYEIVAMQATGVSGRTLRTALTLEQGTLMVFGTVLGVAAGVAGALLALPAVPEFADRPAAPAMRYGIRLLPVVVTGAATVVILIAAIVLSAVSLLRSARYDQLREAQA